MTISARNKLPGTIVEILRGSVMTHVTVQVGENFIEGVITLRSVEEMNLQLGDKVRAVIKSTDVLIQKD